jgi:hypothetical protein
MSEKQEYVGDERDELDVESLAGDENIDPAVFSIRNALEQPDARVYTTLELHSKPFLFNNLWSVIAVNGRTNLQSRFIMARSTSTRLTKEVCYG